MISFQQDREATAYAKEITGKHSPLKDSFDFYYLCFLVGIIQGKTMEAKDAREMIRTYPERYKSNRELYAALLIASKFKNTGIEMKKELVSKELYKILDDHDETHLTSESVNLMNQYAYAGFEIIREKLPKKPSDAPNFLLFYYNQILPECFKEDNW